ncbi:MAG: rhodanese-like domain-containing protein [Planctomycetota bacterium]
MILEQFYLGCLAHASYIVIDERSKTAAVIDPQRDIEQYVTKADQHGAKIKYVLLTHFHADFIAGHLELRNRLGARIYLGAKAEPEYDFTALADGDVLEFGDVRLQALETPGHTPEGISILVFDTAKDVRHPAAVFIGDTLFVGDVGRPDLLASIGYTAEELGAMLYDSLHDKLLPLPDDTIVYPAHGAGSMCGKNLGKETHSTIGEQRRFNYALQPMSKEDFIRIVTAEQPEAPSYFVFDAILNRQERPTLDESLEKALQPLTAEAVTRLQNQGAQIVDVRNAADFAGAHYRGSWNIGLDGKFATWAGTLLDREKPIVLIADPGSEAEAAMRLGRIGLDRVAGYLDGGLTALEAHPELLSKTERITVAALADRLQGSDAPIVIDIRGEKEWGEAHIEGSRNIPLPHLAERSHEIPKDHPFVVICRSGYRSSLAASVLESLGFENLRDTVGGMEAWKASHLPVASPVA